MPMSLWLLGNSLTWNMESEIKDMTFLFDTDLKVWQSQTIMNTKRDVLQT